MKKIISLYKWLLEKDFIREALEVADLYKDASIVDPVAEDLSGIFENGVLKEEVSKTIGDQIRNIQNHFPDLDILDYYLIGASVTYQYDPESDIDTTVVIPKNMSPEEYTIVDKWIEKNIDDKEYYNQRPYNFKITPETSGENSSADAIYNVKNKSWIRRPSRQRAAEEYAELIANKDSYENKIYKLLEKILKRNIENLHKASVNNLSTIDDIGVSDELQSIMRAAYDRYAVIKKWRNQGFEGLDERVRSDERISANWATGNIMYKLLEDEGYHDVYRMAKEAIKSDFKMVDKSFLQTLISEIDDVRDDEIGFVR